MQTVTNNNNLCVKCSKFFLFLIDLLEALDLNVSNGMERQY